MNKFVYIVVEEWWTNNIARQDRYCIHSVYSSKEDAEKEMEEIEKVNPYSKCRIVTRLLLNPRSEVG